jgi:site-specific DNA-methyltransferase (cytosine-N4-specific)
LAYLRRWFDEAAISDLATLRQAVDATPMGFVRGFLQVCLSNIVRSVSWQKETDLRVRKEVRVYETGQGIESFKENLLKQVERIHAYLSVLPKYAQSPSLSVREGNSVNVDRLFDDFRGRVDVVITSPPYATALPYLDTDRLSLVVLGLLSRKVHKDREAEMIGTREVTERERLVQWQRYEGRKSELPGSVVKLIEHIAGYYHAESDEVGFRRRNLPALLGKYYLDMLDAMRSARGLMRKGGKGFYVVGNNSTEISGKRVEIATDEFLFDIGEAAGWKQLEVINMELLHSRDIFRDNRGSKEAILCFKA